MPKSSFSAMAEPITSARSQAAMAISQSTQSATGDRRANSVSRQACARSRPVTMPSFARERLQQNRHQVGDQDHAQQRVAELRAAAEVGGPVARVHVADGDQIARGRRRPASCAARKRRRRWEWCGGLRARTERGQRCGGRTGKRRRRRRRLGFQFGGSDLCIGPAKLTTLNVLI